MRVVGLDSWHHYPLLSPSPYVTQKVPWRCLRTRRPPERPFLLMLRGQWGHATHTSFCSGDDPYVSLSRFHVHLQQGIFLSVLQNPLIRSYLSQLHANGLCLYLPAGHCFRLQRTMPQAEGGQEDGLSGAKGEGMSSRPIAMMPWQGVDLAQGVEFEQAFTLPDRLDNCSMGRGLCSMGRDLCS